LNGRARDRIDLGEEARQRIQDVKWSVFERYLSPIANALADPRRYEILEKIANQRAPGHDICRTERRRGPDRPLHLGGSAGKDGIKPPM
jgi:hypothetical protein